MATVTISLTAGGQTIGRTKTISGQHLVRMLDGLRKHWNQPLWTDEQVILHWIDDTLRTAKANVRKSEQDLATVAAVGQIVDIDFTD